MFRNRSCIGIIYFCLFLFVLVLYGCGKLETPKQYKTSPMDNFDALWHILDERYCFFDIKFKDKDGWNKVYNKYKIQIKDEMSEDELFFVLNSMIGELRDGHVNISTYFDYGRNWEWKDIYPETGEEREKVNLNTNVLANYLGDDYRIAGAISYRMITYNNHANDSIGYMRISSFSSSVNNSNVDGALIRLKDCKGLIIDIRNNGGGSLSYSDLLASHFFNSQHYDDSGKGRLVGYIKHKKSKEHYDFSEPKPVYLKSIDKGVVWLRPVIVITNGGVYSAANDFVMKMKGLKHVVILGDDSGGGSGMPMSSELPNGWGVRYSSCRMTNVNNEDVEFGIKPDVRLNMNKQDIVLDIDTYIERAILEIKKFYKKANKKN